MTRKQVNAIARRDWEHAHSRELGGGRVERPQESSPDGVIEDLAGSPQWAEVLSVSGLEATELVHDALRGHVFTFSDQEGQATSEHPPASIKSETGPSSQLAATDAPADKAVEVLGDIRSIAQLPPTTSDQESAPSPNTIFGAVSAEAQQAANPPSVASAALSPPKIEVAGAVVVDSTPTARVEHKRGRRDSWDWIILISTVGAAVFAAMGYYSGISAEKDRRASDLLAVETQRKTLAAVESSAQANLAADSALRADAKARADRHQAQQDAAATQTAMRRRELVELNKEFRIRFSLLRDTLDAIGLAPTPTRKANEGEYYGRISRAFVSFLSPRDRMQQSYAVGLNTITLLDYLLQRDPDPAVSRARMYLLGITGGRGGEAFSGAGWTTSGADTPSVSFSEPGSQNRIRKPVSEVLSALNLRSWSK